MIPIVFRPIDIWPGTLHADEDRTFSPFRASYGSTLELLDRELEHLRAAHVVLQIALVEGEIRNDGMPRANAKARHPGVILAFDSLHGPLKYATDTYTASTWADHGAGWKANLRAVALGLEALRKVDRYGITTRGEQYTGWKALGAGIAMPSASAGFTTLEAAAAFVAEHANNCFGDEYTSGDILLDHPDEIAGAYREAAKLLHPDVGGDPELFKQLGEAKRMLDEAAR